MGIQRLIEALGYWYTFLTLPLLAVVGMLILRKHRSTGTMLLGIGALAAAAGSLFNKLFPIDAFRSNSYPGVPDWVHLLISFALVVHLIGLNTMTIGLAMVLLKDKNDGV